jgi:hypothetical protein
MLSLQFAAAEPACRVEAWVWLVNLVRQVCEVGQFGGLVLAEQLPLALVARLRLLAETYLREHHFFLSY